LSSARRRRTRIETRSADFEVSIREPLRGALLNPRWGTHGNLAR
jgi:hypothetical protein